MYNRWIYPLQNMFCFIRIMEAFPAHNLCRCVTVVLIVVKLIFICVMSEIYSMLPISLDCPFWLPLWYSLTFIYRQYDWKFYLILESICNIMDIFHMTSYRNCLILQREISMCIIPNIWCIWFIPVFVVVMLLNL